MPATIDSPDLQSVTEIDFDALRKKDLVTFRYWSVSEKEPLFMTGEVVDTFGGSPHHPESITIKTESGEVKTIHATGKVDSHYRTTESGRMIGHDARLRRISPGDSE